MPSVQKAQPQRSVGIVTYNLEIFDQACGCRPDLAAQYVQMSNPPDLTSAKTMLSNGAVPMLEIEPFAEPWTGLSPAMTIRGWPHMRKTFAASVPRCFCRSPPNLTGVGTRGVTGR